MKLLRKHRLMALADKFVIVDGIGREGKSMVARALASMDRVEKHQISLAFDTIPQLYGTNSISHDAAVIALQIEADLYAYNTMISRSINFRPSDDTSVLKDPNPQRYFSRLFADDRQAVSDAITAQKPIFQNMSHNGLSNIGLFLDAFGSNFRFIHIIRDPIIQVHEWFTANFASRIAIDPCELQLSISHNDKTLPLIAHGWEDEYLNASPISRCIKMVATYFKKNLNAYHALSPARKKQVLFVSFESFVTSPLGECDRIAEFVGTNKTHLTIPTLNLDNCPRGQKLMSMLQNKIHNELNELTPRHYLDILDELIDKYNEVTKALCE